jgi:sugar O-acyltransferase (sialic acid O-acetyltransferase NeuD family)
MDGASGYCCVGAGGHARVVIALAGSCGIPIAGVTGPERPRDALLPYLGPDSVYRELLKRGLVRGFVFGLGSVDARTMLRRAELFEAYWRVGGEVPTLVHSSASVAESAHIAPGSVICRGAVLGEDVRVGRNVIVNTGAVVDHECRIADHTHIAPGVTISGTVVVGARTHIGVGATVIQGIEIGESAVVGAGAVVTRSVEAGNLVVGVPARVVGAAASEV